jgi:hypothetical protein
MNGKDFNKNTGLADAASTILPSGTLSAQITESKVSVANIGVGLPGQNHLSWY